MFADDGMVVIGVDTHRDRHAYAVVIGATGVVVDQFDGSADRCGYLRAISRVHQRAPGRRVWAIEGTGSYGAGLVGVLHDTNDVVVEVDRPCTHRHGPRGKTDELDAIRAARSAIADHTHTQPRTGHGPRQCLRVLMIARRGAVAVRTDAIRQLKALTSGLPDPLRDRLRHLNADQLTITCQKLRPPRNDPHTASLITSLRAIAKRCRNATDEANQHKRDIERWVRTICPQLLDETGVGPITAAQLLISWSHPGRLRTEACFARLAGTAPIPASSGNTHRHRLDRGGDRQLNNAIHTIALTRARTDPRTKAYIQRRITEGKTRREAIRALKRHITRHLYRLLQTTTPLDNT